MVDMTNAPGQRLEKLGLVNGVGRGRPIVALVLGIAAQELPGEFGRIEIVQVTSNARAEFTKKTTSLFGARRWRDEPSLLS